MGKRGPTSKPTALKVLEGNPGKRKLNEMEPKPKVEKEVPSPPAFLSAYAKKEWKRIVPELHKLGLLTVIDHAALAAYCQNYHRWITAEKSIRAYEKENGSMTFETESGYNQQIPEIGIANTSMKMMKTFMTEFGLTPSSRSSLHVEKAEEDDNPFAKFRGRGKSG